MTNPTQHGQVPAIQRYKIGYHSDEWGVRSSTPNGIPDASGSWVRYADHVNALAAGQATAGHSRAAVRRKAELLRALCVRKSTRHRLQQPLRGSSRSQRATSSTQPASKEVRDATMG